MAVDKRAAKRELEELLWVMSGHRNDQAAYRHKGDAAWVARCDQALEIDYALIRSHCAEHGLELPHDVPPEDAA